jgi:hypothetical chaperone protein
MAASPQHAVGVDFGTTNSAVAVRPPDGEVQLARFSSRRGERSTFRSILYFHREDDGAGTGPELARGIAAFAGPRAIDRYLETVGSGRLVQSLKSYLADHSFDATNLFNRTTTLSELVTYLARALREEAISSLGEKAFAGAAVVVGRPVHFVGGDTEEDDAFAVNRLKTALVAAGFPASVELEYEPVAAAYHYEARLDHDERILVADFGGGTSDFTLIEVGPSYRGGKAARRILATDGVRLAGDSLDAKILHHVVAPALGLGSHYKSMMGKELEVPVWIYARLRKWHLLSFLRTKRTMDLIAEMEDQANEPGKIEALRHVIENDLGYKLYESVERAKVDLSSSATTRLTFEDEPLHLDVEVRRDDFERWIGEELASIGECTDRTLKSANLTPKDVDRVFMTGGTSMVPAVRQVFADRFGEAKLAGGEELTSVASGLAHRAAAASNI